MQLQALAHRLNHLLKANEITDYCPNGLQVENHDQEITKIAVAVTASLEIIEAAAKIGAQALIVHHGYFWKNESQALVGMKYKRIKALMKHDIALLAYHLPLDVHPEIGNNAKLAEILEVTQTGTFKPDGKLPLVALGELNTPMRLEAFAKKCGIKLNQEPLAVSGGNHLIRKLAWCTGGAQDFIVEAKHSGADAYLSGEVSERTYYQAKELGIHYLSCGHHATERYGIKALGEWIEEEFKIPVQFIDAANPI